MSERRLSELARVLSQPSGIVSSDFPKLRRAATRMGITYDLWQQGLLYLMLGKRENGLYACGEGGTVISICRQVGKTFTIGSARVPPVRHATQPQGAVDRAPHQNLR